MFAYTIVFARRGRIKAQAPRVLRLRTHGCTCCTRHGCEHTLHTHIHIVHGDHQHFPESHHMRKPSDTCTHTHTHTRTQWTGTETTYTPTSAACTTSSEKMGERACKHAFTIDTQVQGTYKCCHEWRNLIKLLWKLTTCDQVTRMMTLAHLSTHESWSMCLRMFDWFSVGTESTETTDGYVCPILVYVCIYVFIYIYIYIYTYIYIYYMFFFASGSKWVSVVIFTISMLLCHQHHKHAPMPSASQACSYAISITSMLLC